MVKIVWEKVSRFKRSEIPSALWKIKNFATLLISLIDVDNKIKLNVLNLWGLTIFFHFQLFQSVPNIPRHVWRDPFIFDFASRDYSWISTRIPFFRVINLNSINTLGLCTHWWFHSNCERRFKTWRRSS